MRKTSINSIYKETGDLNLASQWANHKSTSVTQASYIQPISKSDLKDKIQQRKAKNKQKELNINDEQENEDVTVTETPSFGGKRF